MLNKRLPKLKMSTLLVAVYDLSISGATYPGVPHFILSSFSLSYVQANPKSHMHTLSVLISVINILSGLISLWTIPFLCIKSIANNN